MALPTSNRLKKKKDFDLVFKKGKAANGSFLFIKSLGTDLGKARFGFVVAAKFAPKAVARTKLRRVLSDTLWPKLLPNMTSCDNVVVVTKKLPTDLLEVRQDFVSVLRRAHLI